ncbi:unnamed protein product [Ectocarpus sp. 6 AP-2014]
MIGSTRTFSMRYRCSGRQTLTGVVKAKNSILVFHAYCYFILVPRKLRPHPSVPLHAVFMLNTRQKQQEEGYRSKNSSCRVEQATNRTCDAPTLLESRRTCSNPTHTVHRLNPEAHVGPAIPDQCARNRRSIGLSFVRRYPYTTSDRPPTLFRSKLRLLHETTDSNSSARTIQARHLRNRQSRCVRIHHRGTKNETMRHSQGAKPSNQQSTSSLPLRRNC